MYGSAYFLQKYAKRAMRTCMRDTSIYRRKRKKTRGVRRKPATRVPRIVRHRRRAQLCFGQDVMGPVVLTLIAAVMVIVALSVSGTAVASPVFFIVAAIAALLAGGAIANSIFRNTGQTYSHEKQEMYDKGETK